MTAAELVLWQHLRANRLDGLPFRRQVVIGGFIVDFYRHRLRLAVEVDGYIHEARREYDEERTEILARVGVSVLRFTNEDVTANVFTVLRRIRDVCRILKNSDPQRQP